MQSINMLISQDGIMDCLFVLVHHINVHNNNLELILDFKCFEFIMGLLDSVETTMQNRKLCFRLIGNCTAGENHLV